MNTHQPTFARAKTWACRLSSPVVIALLVVGCAHAQQPTEPTVSALPGPGMSQQSFQSANVACHEAAQTRTDLPGATPANTYVPVISQQHLYNVVYGQCMAARGSTVNGIGQDPFTPYAFPGYSSLPGMGQ